MNNKVFKTRFKKTVEHAQDGLEDRINVIVNKYKIERFYKYHTNYDYRENED